jgi:hypothetical protein
MTDAELWAALEALGDDLLDPTFPEELVDEELRALGLDPEALAERASSHAATAGHPATSATSSRPHG